MMTEPKAEVPSGGQSAPPAEISLDKMLVSLSECSGFDFAARKTEYEYYSARAQLAVDNSPLYDRLFALRQDLAGELVAGKIAGVDHWASGESEFRTVVKAWAALTDKLYRVNREENALFSNPPILPTVGEVARNEPATLQRWITPSVAGEVLDDLVRTKFVVPFVDGVIDVSARLTKIFADLGVQRFRRFHAKDTGYHARHYYALVEVPGDDSIPPSTVALEIKVLTKMQDQLGELTHLLYERHRTGSLKLEKKRKSAWQFDTPDFLATYLGHTGHFLEAKICDLKESILSLDSEP
jgi:hypothetical protein